MRRTDTNFLLLSGKVTYSKAWPPKNGNTFTNGTVKISPSLDPDNLIQISTKLTTGKSQDEINIFENIFSVGREITIVGGSFGGYEKVGVGWVFQIDAKLWDVSITKTNSNLAIVTGTIWKKGKAPGGLGLIIEILYKAMKEKNLKAKKAKILLADELVPEWLSKGTTNGAGDRILVSGKCCSGNEGPYIKAESISQIQ